MRKLKAVDLSKYETHNSLVNINNDYDQTLTYNTYDKVVYNNNVYISAKDNNTSSPDDELSWSLDGPSNRTALYDNYPTTASTTSNDEIVLMYENLNNISMLAFGNLTGSMLKIEVIKSDGSPLLEKEIKLSKYDEPTNWWEYYFEFGEQIKIKDHIENIQTMEVNIKIKITIFKDENGTAGIGFIAFGRLIQIGATDINLIIDKTPTLSLDRIDGRLVEFGGNGWKKYSYILCFPSIKTLYDEMKKLDEEDGVLSFFVGDNTGDILIYSVIGISTGYSLDVPNLRANLTVYAVDDY